MATEEKVLEKDTQITLSEIEIMKGAEKDVAPGMTSSEDGSLSDEEPVKNADKNAPISNGFNEGSQPATAVAESEGDAFLLSELATNKKWVLKSHPPSNGAFVAERDLELIPDALDLSKLAKDEVLVRVDILAIDSFLRIMIDAGEIGTVKPNDPIQAMGVGTVLKTHDDEEIENVHEFSVGSVVVGLLTAAKYAIVKSNVIQEKIAFAKPSSALGVLGIVGETAYIGTFVVPSKEPKKGEMVVVIDAASPIGCLVCQMARFSGAQVVGIIGCGVGCNGGEEKQRFLMDDLKLDGVVDCEGKSISSGDEPTLMQELEKVCPNGIDFVFDTVGGVHLDVVLNHINTKSRVVVCDAISQYQSLGEIRGPSNYLKLVEKSATLHGFNVMDFPEHSFAISAYLAWNYMRETLVFPQRIETGLDMFASSMESYFSKEHFGRLLVQVSDQFETSEFSVPWGSKQKENETNVGNVDTIEDENVKSSALPSTSDNEEKTEEKNSSETNEILDTSSSSSSC